jgi:hypothetical protein
MTLRITIVLMSLALMPNGAHAQTSATQQAPAPLAEALWTATRAGDVAKNEMKEVIMSTPALSDGVLIVRTLDRVYGIGQK